MPEQVLLERASLAEASAATDTPGRLAIQVITPGWGSSGYYSPQVCEAAAPLVTVGTQMFLDHPSETEERDRPERSVRDIAAIVTETAHWDPVAQAVIAECEVVGPYRELLTNETFASSIGLSIRGSATDVVEGEAEGRRGRIIEGLAAISSVDFVTRAGRGGRVLSVLESARDAAPETVISRAVAHGVAEATADERREQLVDAVRSAYGHPDRWCWVRDFDDTTVWFETSAEDEPSHTWQQAYTVAADDLSVVLTGARIAVRPVTQYVPATRPDSNTPTTESEEDTMHPNTLEESHRALDEANGRVTTLEAERDTALQERDEARRRLAERDRTDRARVIVAERAREASVTFDDLQVAGILAALPVTEAGDLDEAAFTTTVDRHATALAERQATTAHQGGAGTVTGFGGTPTGTQSTVTEADLDALDDITFGTVKGA